MKLNLAVLRLFALTAVASLAVSVSADLAPPTGPTVVSSIAEARKKAIDAWNKNEPYAPYVEVTGTVTVAPNDSDDGPGGTFLSSSYFVIQDSGSVGTVISGKTYSNAIKVFCGSSDVIFSSIEPSVPVYNRANVRVGDIVTVRGAASILTNIGTTNYGMEVQIVSSLIDSAGPPVISTPYDGMVKLIGIGSAFSPVSLTIEDLPNIDGVAGAENVCTRNSPAAQHWYPLPSNNDVSPYYLKDNPYAHMVVTLNNVRKWGKFVDSSNKVTSFFLTSTTNQNNVLRVRCSTQGTGIPGTGYVENGSTDPVTGIFETRQLLVGQTPYSVAQLIPRKKADVVHTSVSTPYFERTSTFVDGTTTDRKRLPGSVAVISAYTDAPGQTVTADLSAFGLGTQTLAAGPPPPPNTGHYYSYNLTIPIGQAAGQYKVPIYINGTIGADTLVDVAKQVATVGETYALPDDMYVDVTTNVVALNGALTLGPSSPPEADTDPTFEGFASWIWASDHPTGYPSVLLFNWPWGGTPGNRTKYNAGDQLQAFGKLLTFNTTREIEYPSVRDTYTITTSLTSPVPKSKFTTLKNIDYYLRPSVHGAFIKVYGTVSTAARHPVDNSRVFYVTDATGKTIRVRANWRNVTSSKPFTLPPNGSKVVVQGFFDQFYQENSTAVGWQSPMNTLHPSKQSDIVVVAP